ncbi:radical SAM protein [Candidatus Omnitrophota bacterium]
MNEISFFTQEMCKLFYPRRLDSLIFYPTSRCNARCDFCFYRNELNQRCELTLPKIVEITKKIGFLKGLMIGGGEPFLRTDLFEIVDAFVTHCKTNVIQVPTNGYFTSATLDFVNRLMQRHPDVNLTIQISIDALEAKHDDARGLKDCFKRACETAISLRELRGQNKRLRLLIVSVLSPETMADCRQLAAYVQDEIQPDLHWFEPVRDRLSDCEKFVVPKEIIAFLRKNLKFYWNNILGATRNVYASKIFNKFIAAFSLAAFDIAFNNFLYDKPWPVVCCASKRVAVLYSDGMLAACELRKESVDLSDYDGSIARALCDPIFKDVRKQTRKHKCDCTHGCFIPTSLRYAPWQWFLHSLY